MSRQRKPLPLRSHLIALVGAAVVPVILFSAAMLLKVVQQEQAALRGEVDEMSAQLLVAVDNELQRTVAALEVLALTNAVKQGNLAQIHAVATRLVSAHPGWSNVTLLGPNGEHLVNARVPYGTPLPPLTRPDLPREAARLRKPIVSDMVSAVMVRRALTVVYVPVIEDNAVKYVLSAAFESPNWRALLRAQLLSRFDAVLLDREGNVITRTVEHDTRLNADQAAALARSEAAGGAERYGDMLVSRRTSPQSGWTVVVYRLADTRAFLSGALAMLVSGFVLLLGAGIALALLFGGRIAAAMRAHAASVRAVGSGAPPLPAPGRIAEIQQAHEALEDAARLLEARWRRAQEALAAMEKSDRAKEEFIALLSHELRSPIATVLNALTILGDPRTGKASADEARAVIARQTRQMARLVEDLLDVARISRGKLSLRRERLDLNELVASAANDYREAMRKAGVEFVVHAAGPLWVHGDATRLAQIVANLLQNAVKFTPAGGRVVLSLAAAGPEAARIVVRDTGAGIEPELVESMFDPFVQGPLAAKGLGVGLSLVKNLAELHGGRVTARSEGVGRGAEFVVTLPLARGSEPETQGVVSLAAGLEELPDKQHEEQHRGSLA